MRLRAVVLVAVLLTVGVDVVVGAGRGLAHAGELLGYGLRLEAGVEHDSNPARLEEVAGVPGARTIEGSPALRLVSTADFAAALGRQVLSLGGGLAAKRFLLSGAQAEDLLIADARAGTRFRLGERWGLAVGAGYYDVFQRADGLGDARDFRSITPSLRIERELAGGVLAAGAGWRWFSFKPESSFDFHGPTGQASYHRSLTGDAAEGARPAAQWDFGAGASVEDRWFDVRRCLSLGSCPGPASSASRRDRFWAGQLDVSRTSTVLLGAGLMFGFNDSNSYGESLWRLTASGRAVLLLPWQLSLSARGELVVTRYRDAVPVGYNAMTGRFVSIEDEGRSNLRLELVAPLGKLELGARYTFYGQMPGGGLVEFRRQIVLLYLAVAYP
jgi:hypothetical protein